MGRGCKKLHRLIEIEIIRQTNKTQTPPEGRSRRASLTARGRGLGRGWSIYSSDGGSITRQGVVKM